MRVRWYLRELDVQPKVVISLKTQMVNAEAIEALQHGCSTWTLRQKHNSKFRTVHHRVLSCIIRSQRQRSDQTIGLLLTTRALDTTGCKSIETNLCGRGRSSE
ncbi:unnamed protein product [Ascophyllum nodosum]